MCMKPPAAGFEPPRARSRTWSVIAKIRRKKARPGIRVSRPAGYRGALIADEHARLTLRDIQQAGELRIVHGGFRHRPDARIDVLRQPYAMGSGIAVPDPGKAHHVWILDDQGVDR